MIEAYDIPRASSFTNTPPSQYGVSALWIQRNGDSENVSTLSKVQKERNWKAESTNGDQSLQRNVVAHPWNPAPSRGRMLALSLPYTQPQPQQWETFRLSFWPFEVVCASTSLTVSGVWLKQIFVKKPSLAYELGPIASSIVPSGSLLKLLPSWQWIR